MMKLSLFRRAASVTNAEEKTAALPAHSAAVTAQSLGLPATVPPPAPPPRRASVIGEPAPPVHEYEIARVLLAVDATWSRLAAWEASQRVMDALFEALPGEVLVALAVHGGGEVHTFTEFLPDVRALRRKAARIECLAGHTALIDILARVLDVEDHPVRVVIYIGDVFEESPRDADRLAEELAARGTSVIILHDRANLPARQARAADAVFQRIAAITGGAVLPFDAAALDELRAMLEAVAVLAVGGEEMLEAQQATMPAAPVLLERIAESKQLLIGHAKR
jgi:hypothetical protein